jgi:hypothetical protein
MPPIHVEPRTVEEVSRAAARLARVIGARPADLPTVKNAAFRLASDFELAHRVPHADSRRMLFAKQEELMALLDHSWAQRPAAEHAAILVQHPFRD